MTIDKGRSTVNPLNEDETASNFALSQGQL